MSKAKVYAVDTINGTVELDIAGAYFKLMVAPAAVAEIELLNSGNQALQALDVPAGFYQRIAFNKIRIRHTGVQAIKILVAPLEGGSDNFTGTFTAQGTLGTLAQLALGGVNTLQITDRGASFGTTYTSSTAVGATSNNQVFAAASNTNGARIVKAAFLTNNGTAGGTPLQSAYHAHTGAPAGPTDGDLLAIIRNSGGSGTRIWGTGDNESSPIIIASGKGLWFRNGNAEAETVAQRSVLYDLF